MKTCKWGACTHHAIYDSPHGPICLEHAQGLAERPHAPELTRLPLDTETLAHLLSEEFERDNWGDIEPDLIWAVANPASDDEADSDATTSDIAGMRAVLSRVAERWNKGDL